MTTVLFVGAGRHQRRAIEQARARGLRVVAVDRNPDAPGLVAADIAEVVDFMEIDAVVAVARRVGVDGVLTVSADRAVPVVAALAEELGLPAGVEVTEVREGTPAAEAGLRAGSGSATVDGQSYPTGGDVITSIDGKAVTTGAELQTAIDSKSPGDTVSITYSRDGKTTTVEVSLGTRPS